MQGQRRTIGPLPERFDSGSASSDAVVDQQICWSNMRNSTDLSDYLLSSSEAGVTYMNSVSQDRQDSGRWILGESSSSAGANQVNHDEQKTEHGWSSSIGVGQAFDEQRHESGNNGASNSVDANLSNQIANRPMLMQGHTSDSVSRDINVNSGFLGHGLDNCLAMDLTDMYRSDGSGNVWIPPISSSSDPFGLPSRSGGYLDEESNARPGCSLEGRRLSCKRKALEGNVGQSSGSGSSNYFPPGESSLWHSIPSQDNRGTALRISASTENPVSASPSQQVNPRLGLGVGIAFEGPPVFGGSGNAESSLGNFCVRNSSHQPDSAPTNVFSARNPVGHFNIPSSANQSSRNLQLDNFLDLMSASEADDANPQGQPDMHLPAFGRNLQSSRWNIGSSSRSGSSPSFVLSGERESVLQEDSNSRRIPRNISEHPMFAPAIEMRNSFRSPANWSLAGGNISIAGNIASTSRAGSRSSVHSSSSEDRVPPRYPRRLSELVRRSLLSATGSESGGQSSQSSLRLGPLSSSQETPISSGSGRQGRHPSHSRSAVLLERHLDSAFGIPYSVRTLASASEGRSRLVSEIRNVLDLMRRGEGLRFEDVMILDQSGFFGMADYDRHRDMRLDIDNMTYEELLSLEERIGHVCTGLKEETILNHLKQWKYLSISMEDQQDTEPCCICQEEYNDGDDLGKLDCGHDFHRDCIKQWLMRKNLCPVCKMTGLVT